MESHLVLKQIPDIIYSSDQRLLDPNLTVTLGLTLFHLNKSVTSLTIDALEYRYTRRTYVIVGQRFINTNPSSDLS